VDSLRAVEGEAAPNVYANYKEEKQSRKKTTLISTMVGRGNSLICEEISIKYAQTCINIDPKPPELLLFHNIDRQKKARMSPSGLSSFTDKPGPCGLV
jgi:hypothetical protein